MEIDGLLGEETKVCPECAETIKFKAKKCRYCKAQFDPTEVDKQVEARRDELAKIAKVQRDELDELAKIKEGKVMGKQDDKRTAIGLQPVTGQHSLIWICILMGCFIVGYFILR